jgi:acetyl esterase
MTLPPPTAALLRQLTERFPPPDFARMDTAAVAAYLASSRAATTTRQATAEPVGAVRDVRIGERRIAGRVYHPLTAAGDGGVVLYLHGGGWVTGGLEMNDGVCRALANRAGCVVVASTYRLAPEHPFPAALDDVGDAWRWVYDHSRDFGADGSRVALVGSSAGGNLAVAACLRDTPPSPAPTLPPPLFLGLAYPVLDGTMASESYRTNGTGLFLTAEQMAWYWAQYVPDAASRGRPDVSPGLADDLSGLPPTLVISAEFDPLRDEAEAFGLRLATSGVPATLYRARGQLHSFLSLLGSVPEADRCLDILAAAVRSAFGR